MPNGNIFEVSLRETLELFGPFLTGAPGGFALAIGEAQPNAAVRNAIESSVAALGYGKNATAFASLGAASDGGGGTLADAGTAAGDGAASGPTLDAQALYLLVEGLDPLFVITTDETATGLFAKAYRTTLAADAHARVAGRTVVAFEDLASLMDTAENKQRAWALLKSIPKRD